MNASTEQPIQTPEIQTKNSGANPHICCRCHRSGDSCCKVRNACENDIQLPVSETEVKKIMTLQKGKEKRDFFDIVPNTRQFIDQIGQLFPDRSDSVTETFPKTTNHYELKTVNDSCIFLNDSGCSLPTEVRPLSCRIYPFWFLNGEPMIFQDSHCLALRLYKNIPEVLLSLGTSPGELIDLYNQMCHAWGLCHPMPQEQIACPA